MIFQHAFPQLSTIPPAFMQYKQGIAACFSKLMNVYIARIIYLLRINNMKFNYRKCFPICLQKKLSCKTYKIFGSISRYYMHLPKNWESSLFAQDCSRKNQCVASLCLFHCLHFSCSVSKTISHTLYDLRRLWKVQHNSSNSLRKVNVMYLTLVKDQT